MKILFLNYEYPPLGGGAGVASEALMKEWAKDPGIEVHLVTSAVGQVCEEACLGNRTYVHRLPIGKDPHKIHSQSLRDIFVYTWKTLFFLRAFLARENKREKFDVTLAFFTLPSGFIAYLVKVFYGVPYTISLRGADVPGFSEKYDTFYLFFRPLTRLLWKKAAHVLTNSVGLRELALKTSLNQRISIIENGVDTDYFQPSPKKDEKTVTFLSLSRLTPRKGIDMLIRAFVLAVGKTSTPLRLVIAGSGEQKSALHELAGSLGMEEKISFVGAVSRSDLSAEYGRADVFVMASKNEGMSNAALEAMASGLPLVVSGTGGMTELVTDGVNGFFIDPDDSPAFAETLVNLAENRSLREAFGKESRERAEKRGWRSRAAAYAATLQSRE